MEKLKWEQVTDDGCTWRLRVRGGWLVRYMDDVMTDMVQGVSAGYEWRSCMVFVLDRKHLWEV